MRNVLIFLLSLLLCLQFAACGSVDHEFQFYYPRREFAFGNDAPVIVSEKREAPGHQDDLQYLLTMYLEGPLDGTLASPFPEGISLKGFTYSDATLYVTLNDAYAKLDGIDHTIASTCLAYTCFDLTAAEKVVIKCNSVRYGNRSITLYRDSVLLTDNSTAPVETQPQ